MEMEREQYIISNKCTTGKQYIGFETGGGECVGWGRGGATAKKGGSTEVKRVVYLL